MKLDIIIPYIYAHFLYRKSLSFPPVVTFTINCQEKICFLCFFFFVRVSLINDKRHGNMWCAQIIEIIFLLENYLLFQTLDSDKINELKKTKIIYFVVFLVEPKEEISTETSRKKSRKSVKYHRIWMKLKQNQELQQEIKKILDNQKMYTHLYSTQLR